MPTKRNKHTDKTALAVVTAAASAAIAFLTSLGTLLALWEGHPSLVKFAPAAAIGLIWGWCAYSVISRYGPRFSNVSHRLAGWATIGGALGIPLLASAALLAPRFISAQSKESVVVLVARFDGPQQQNYRVTDLVLSELRQASRKFSDIKIVSTDQAFSEANGDADVVSEGAKRGADIVLWGWYGTTPTTTRIAAHLRVVPGARHAPELVEVDHDGSWSRPSVDFGQYTFQDDVSRGLTSLALMAVATVRFSAKDFDGAIQRAEAAASAPGHPLPNEIRAEFFALIASAAVMKHDVQRAVDASTQSIQLNPDTNASAYQNRAVALIQKGDPLLAKPDLEKAISLFSTQLTTEPNNINFLTHRGWDYWHIDQYDEAILDYNRALQISRSNPTLLAERGQIYFANSELENARNDFVQALTIRPDDEIAHDGLCMVYLRQGRRDLAVAEIRAILAKHPDDASSHYNLAIVYLERGEPDPDRAIPELDRTIQLDPSGNAYVHRGVAYGLKHNSDREKADIETALKQKPTSYEVQYHAGMFFESRGDPKHAADAFGEALGFLGGHYGRDTGFSAARRRADLLYRRARALAALAQFNAAMSDTVSALQLQPNDPDSRILRARLLADKGDFEGAALDLKVAFDNGAHTIGALQFSAFVHERTGNWRGAGADLTAALQQQPQDVGLLFDRAELFRRHANVRESAKDYQTVIDIAEGRKELDEQDENILGYAYSRLGRSDEAVRTMRHAVARFKDSWNAYDSLAEMLASLGDNSEAIRNYETALKLAPEDKQDRIRHDLTRLRKK